MDVVFLEDGSIEFIVAKDSLTIHFRIARPFKYGIEKWRFIRNGGLGEVRYEGFKMLCKSINMTLIFYVPKTPKPLKSENVVKLEINNNRKLI